MKNIHLLPTKKPSRLFKFANELHLDTTPKDYYKKYHIYITSDEDINENDYIITKDGILVQVSYLLSKDLQGASKIILTTDQDLIADGVQAIDDEFLEWFVKNPSCESVVVDESKYFDGSHGEYIIIIPQEEPNPFEYTNTNDFTSMVYNPQEEPKQETLTYTEAAKKEERIFNSTMISKQETLEEAAERLQKDKYGIFISKDADVKGQLVIDTARAAFLSGMTEGAKWQAEQIPSIIGEYLEYIWKSGYIEPKKWFEQFKKK
jgi:hypothetical protein